MIVGLTMQEGGFRLRALSLPNNTKRGDPPPPPPPEIETRNVF